MSLLSKISGNLSLLIIACLILLTSCKKTEVDPVTSDTDVATKWADLTLNTIRKSLYKSPTYASRSLGYMGVTMYESVVYSDANSRSLASQLNGLTNLPLPQAGTDYKWILAMNERSKRC